MAKGKRRANGEGSFYKLPDGRWAASAMIQKPDGGYTRVKREGKTRAEAAARLAEARRAIAGGADGAGRLPTVGEHLEAWYRDTFSPGARPASRRTYRCLIDHQIAPFVGKARLDRLSRPMLRKWLADLARPAEGRDGYSPKTISLARSVLRQALDQAVDDGLTAANPLTRRIAGPKVKMTSGKALTPEQARALLAAARGDRLELAIRLALGLGLRRGEVCGLRWQDIDLAAGTLAVAGQMTYSAGCGLEYAPTKTATAIRVLKLPAVLVSAIRWHQTRQEAERNVMGWAPSPYLFTSAESGGPLYPAAVYDGFKRICKVAGLDGFRLHDLRHSAASFLLAEGVPLKRVQAILGHARGSTTLNTYGHLLPGDDDDAAERLQRRIGGDDDTGQSPDDLAAEA